MRHILIDRARAKKAVKRGGPDARRVPLTGVLSTDAESPEVVGIHDQLTQLAAIDQRQAAIVELRFFAGLSVPEVAKALGVSERTVELDWRAARAWLRLQLKDSSL